MCDHCVVLLLDDLERASALLPTIREQLKGINASSAAWDRLHRLNVSIADLQVFHAHLPAAALPPLAGRVVLNLPPTPLPPQSKLRSPPGPHYQTAQQLQTLEQQSTSLQQDTERLGSQVRPMTLSHVLTSRISQSLTPKPPSPISGAPFFILPCLSHVPTNTTAEGNCTHPIGYRGPRSGRPAAGHHRVHTGPGTEVVGVCASCGPCPEW